MLNILKPAKDKCYVCGTTENVVETEMDGKKNTLCWKHAQEIFNSHAGVKKARKKKEGNKPARAA